MAPTIDTTLRTGRHCAYLLHVHLVFVTKFRHRVFTNAHLARIEEIMTDVLTQNERELVEFNGESNHVHLLLLYPPKQAISDLAHGCKGRSSAIMRSEYPEPARHYSRAKKLWSGSYFASSVGGAPISVLRQYTEQHDRPTNLTQTKTALHHRAKARCTTPKTGSRDFVPSESPPLE